MTNTEKRTPDDLFRRSIDACFILYFLATCTNMFGSPFKDLSALVKNADVSFVGGLILRHQQMIPCNVHSVRNSDRILIAILFQLNPPFLLTEDCFEYFTVTLVFAVFGRVRIRSGGTWHRSNAILQFD